MNLTKEEKEEEERLTIRKKVTLEDLAMQPLEFSFDISTSENEKRYHFKYGIGSSNPGFFLRVGKMNKSKLFNQYW